MSSASEKSAAGDAATLERWWQTFVATAKVPEELDYVQGRLIRQVHRAQLPSGLVYIKTMSFPRAKDRLRYSVRALPAEHEARMLRHVAAAGLPCPEVLAVRTSRRRGLPHRSMLVLRGLSVAADPVAADPVAADPSGPADPVSRAVDEVRLAAKLLEACVFHRDLHTDNFVRLADGRLAVLDLQSACVVRPQQAASASVRHAVAARIVRDRHGAPREAALAELERLGVVQPAERAAVEERCRRDVRRYAGSRRMRCWKSSTCFERRLRWDGVELRLRGTDSEGRWWFWRRPSQSETGSSSPRDLADAWEAQWARHVASGHPDAAAQSLPLRRFFRKWWWLGGRTALYVSAAYSDAWIQAEVDKAYAAILGQSPANSDGPTSDE
ncbi:MAG: lipopolysaccharide kinase InaA family protein [Planctomycetota bacterium]